jgi:hypothetical protein
LVAEAFYVGFSRYSEGFSFGASALEEGSPLLIFGISGHVTAKGFAEEFAHGAVFALCEFLRFDEEVRWEGDRDCLGGAHV